MIVEQSNDAPRKFDEEWLPTIALILCDPELWGERCFTFEEAEQFESIVLDCISAVDGVPGCEWMIEPLSNALDRIQAQTWLNQFFDALNRFMRGEQTWQ